MPIWSRFYLGAVIVSVLLSVLAPVRLLERQLWDVNRQSITPSDDIVILAIDNQSIQALGRFPWDRQIYAGLLQKLSEPGNQPLSVTFDVSFSEPQNDIADKQLEQAISQSPFRIVLATPVIFTANQATPSQLQLPLKYFRDQPVVQLGHVYVATDGDRVARWFPTDITVDDLTLPPLALAALPEVDRPDPSGFVEYAGSAGSITTIPFVSYYRGDISPASLAGKRVFIGATASDLHDVLASSVRGNVLSGVEWHANVLLNALSGQGVAVPSFALRLIIFISVLGLLVLLRFIRPTKWYSSAMAVLILALCIGQFISWQNKLALPVLASLILVVLVFIIELLLRWWTSELEKRRLKQTLNHYFSPAVLKHVLAHPSELKLGGQRKEVSIFFSDIRSFTTLSEQLPPELLSNMLHDYFTVMTEEVLASDGVVDKFIGDAIMAFWGAPLDQPDHAERAVRTAIRMLERLKEYQPKWQAKGYPLIQIGIGIHSGWVTVGNLGSDKRFDYTVVGDPVNAASRLEGLTKEYKVPLVFSGETAELLPDDIVRHEIGCSVVKGKSKEIHIWTIDDINKYT